MQLLACVLCVTVMGARKGGGGPNKSRRLSLLEENDAIWGPICYVFIFMGGLFLNVWATLGVYGGLFFIHVEAFLLHFFPYGKILFMWGLFLVFLWDLLWARPPPTRIFTGTHGHSHYVVLCQFVCHGIQKLFTNN